MVRTAGARSKCAEFAKGIYETGLGQDEIVERVRIAKLSPDSRWGYAKLCRKAGEFADALAVAVIDPARGHSRIVIGAANGAPLVLNSTSQLSAEGRRDIETLRKAVGLDLDQAAGRNFDTFQRTLHTVAAIRAVQQAAS